MRPARADLVEEISRNLDVSVAHPIMCDACHKENFTGFRYRCQKCHSYQLCQDCFWRGKVSGTHNNDHETREYSSFVRVI